MTVRDWFLPPRSLLTLYLAGAALTIACLGWMAVRQWQQDVALDAQRTAQRLEGAASLAAARLLQQLAEIERSLGQPPERSSPHAQVVTGADGGFRVIAGRLPYVPEPLPSAPAPEGVFGHAEHLEVQSGGRGEAVAAYRRLTSASSPAVRAGALVRLARVLRQLDRPDDALRVYAELQTLPELVVEGRPADLIARLGRCAVLERMQRHDDLAAEAATLMSELERGRWPIGSALWASVAADAARWADNRRARPRNLEDELRAAGALEQFWRDRQGSPLARSTRAAVHTAHGDAIVLAQPTSDGTRLLVVSPARVAMMRRGLADDTVQIALLRPDAPRAPVVGARAVTLPAGDTGLPWTLVAADADPGRAHAEANARRTVLIGGLSLVGLLILASGYLTFRGIRREIEVASLQSEFVSAVSHEFRTPLTSIRQLSHMLHTGRVSSDERRHQYYAVLVRESERLHRLVERMLGVGRADAGRFRFELLEAGALVRKVVSDFSGQAGVRPIATDLCEVPCPIRGDGELLALAIWNLLDNAVKYSGGDAPVTVSVQANAGHAAIAVQDRGVGIAPADHVRIFSKFVRGPSESVAATPGSGLGLAFVDRVVRAHGGRVDLISEPGQGSTFTILLPIVAVARAVDQPIQAEEMPS